MKREKKGKGMNHNDVHYIQGKRDKEGLAFPSLKTQPSPAFKPKGLNAGIKPRLEKLRLVEERESYDN